MGGSGRDLASIIYACGIRGIQTAILQRPREQANVAAHISRSAHHRIVTALPIQKRASEMRHRYCVTFRPGRVSYIACAMKVPEPLEHESFPDSAYAQELRRGFPDLRFASDLERSFQESYLARSRRRVRFFQLALGLLAIAAAAGLSVLRALPLDEVALGLMVVVIPACVALALTSRSVERQLRTLFLERGLLSELVARDGLTGLKNRGAFDDDYARLWQQAMRDRRALALLLIDVDHFMAYNDRYGHQAGDAALQRVAHVTQRFARRPLDIAARYGGEEFLVALYDLGADPVREIAEELRESVQALGIQHDDSPAGVVTVSIGVSIVSPRPGRSAEGAVQLADEALYAAKRGGRNGIRVVDCYGINYSTGAFRRSA
jgi:diguanylate cyclase (GGDEF)-like protein